MKRVYVVGTADTKGLELQYVKSLVERAGAPAILVNVGITPPRIAVDVTAEEVASCHPKGAEFVLGGTDRGAAVAAMGDAFAQYIMRWNDIAGVVGLGGGGGTSIVTAGMRQLPIGIPKLMVSTLASGEVRQFVGSTDITMMYSITDIAGLNRISRVILGNAAHAIAGMALHKAPEVNAKPSIGLTMFGVTTPCVTQIVSQLEADFECLVFHATGVGGQSMERLADSGVLVGIIDLTTTEVCDHLVGGVLSAGADRLGAIARSGIPYVGSVGALDMVNFWSMETVPERFRDRTLYKHNPNVTLMRTTAEECRVIGQWIAEKLNRCVGPVRFLIPEKGVSALDAPGLAFHDPSGDAALFDALESALNQTDSRRLIRLPFHINDPEFSTAVVQHFRQVIER